MIAVVLTPLGAWLTLKPKRTPSATQTARLPDTALVAISAAVGAVGGIYGIGGGSILAPILIGAGRPASDVAPATLASTFVTSIAGVVTFVALAASRHGPVAPDWGVGIALGVGGLAGAYTGARLQPRLPETVIRRVPGSSSSPSVSATPPSSADLSPHRSLHLRRPGRNTTRPHRRGTGREFVPRHLCGYITLPSRSLQGSRSARLRWWSATQASWRG